MIPLDHRWMKVAKRIVRTTAPTPTEKHAVRLYIQLGPRGARPRSCAARGHGATSRWRVACVRQEAATEIVDLQYVLFISFFGDSGPLSIYVRSSRWVWSAVGIRQKHCPSPRFGAAAFTTFRQEIVGSGINVREPATVRKQTRSTSSSLQDGINFVGKRRPLVHASTAPDFGKHCAGGHYPTPRFGRSLG